MALVLAESAFPLLLSEIASNLIRGIPQSLGHMTPKPPLPYNWKNHLLANNDKGKDFFLSFIPSDSKDVVFSKYEVDDDKLEWCYSLVGYATGKRPFYGSLLAAIKRK